MKKKLRKWSKKLEKSSTWDGHKGRSQKENQSNKEQVLKTVFQENFSNKKNNLKLHIESIHCISKKIN